MAPPLFSFPQLGTSSNNSQLTTQSSTTSTSTNVKSEHQKVFKYLPTTRPGYKGKGKQPLKKIVTCTIKFCCLGSSGTDKPPTTVAAKTSLANAGLGPSSITFEMTGCTVHQNILERYPKLVDCGGYELLLYQRGGDEQGFHVLPPPYTPSRVKEIANASVVYIRPLQKDLMDINDSLNWQASSTCIQEVK